MKTEFFFNAFDGPTRLDLNEEERKDLNRCLAYGVQWFITKKGHKVNLFNVDWIDYMEEIEK